MKVLQVIPSLRTGGAEKLIVDLAPFFIQNGIDVDVCVFDSIETPFMKKLVELGIAIHGFGSGNNVYNPLNFIRLYKIYKNYDIIHAHCLPPQFFASLCSFFGVKNIITTEHSTSNKLRHIIGAKYIERVKYSRFKRIICITKEVKEKLNTFLDFNDGRFSIIENGINVELYHNAEPINNFAPDGVCVITQVAGLRPQKDQDTLIRAIKLLDDKNFHLYLIGDGIRRKKIEKLTEDLSIGEQVHLLGVRSDVPNILKSSDIIVMSSHWEGFGLAAVEGMAAEKPVIASDVPGLGQVVEGGGILFPTSDDKKLAEEIKHLAEDKEYYSTIASRCYAKSKQYDIKKMVREYIKIYNDVYKSNKI